MATTGLSFAEVLKLKIQREAEDAKIRLVEEAQARQEEAKAREARQAQLKLKQERLAALRESQPVSEKQEDSRFYPNGRRRYGPYRSFMSGDLPRLTEQVQASSENPQPPKCSPVSESTSDSKQVDSIPSSQAENGIRGNGATDSDGSRSDISPEKDRQQKKTPEVSINSTKIAENTTPASRKENAGKPGKESTETAISNVVLQGALDNLALPATSLKQNGLTSNDTTRRKAASPEDDGRLAQKSNGAQSQRRNGSSAYVDSQPNGNYRHQWHQPDYNGYHTQQQHGHRGADASNYQNHTSNSSTQSFYGGSSQYYQPVTEITTRNGPLFVNPLAYQLYDASLSDVYGNDLSNGYYGQNNSYVDMNGNSDGPSSVISPVPCIIKSFYFDSQQTELIAGRNGQDLNEISWKFNCEIWIDDEEAKKSGVSTLHLYGLEDNVDLSVDRIRRRLEFSGGELHPIVGIQTGNELHPPITKLDLPEGVSLHAFVSHVDETGLVYLQLPSNPSYLKICGLEVQLTNHCADTNVSPFIDLRHSPVVEGCVVAASVNDDSEQWLRAVVISRPGENGEVLLRSLDHGFPFKSRASCLKFLPVEFCVTAVQAIECRVVSGRFDYEKSVEEQINTKLNSSISKQWVKVKAVAREEETGLPVVELFIISHPNAAVSARNVVAFS